MAHIPAVPTRPDSGLWFSFAAALVVVVLLLWALASGDQSPAHRRTTAPIATQEPDERVGLSRGSMVKLAPAPVYSYLEFVGLMGARPHRQMSVRHDYTADGLRALASALEAIAPAHPRALTQDEIDALRARANAIQRNTVGSHPAAHVREAFLSAADMLDAAGARDAAELRRIAQSITVNQGLLSQSREVRHFFRRSAESLRNLSTGMTTKDSRPGPTRARRCKQSTSNVVNDGAGQDGIAAERGYVVVPPRNPRGGAPGCPSFSPSADTTRFSIHLLGRPPPRVDVTVDPGRWQRYHVTDQTS